MDFSCFEMIERDYKFYLSFENGICEDYLTEKVWNALQRFLVPVVMAGGNLPKMLPPNSYIDVANFTSPKALADYLMKVASNDDLYRSYFEWKQHYVIERISHLECSLCEYLNTHSSVESRVVPSFNAFWDPKTNCLSSRKYFKRYLNPRPQRSPIVFPSTNA